MTYNPPGIEPPSLDGPIWRYMDIPRFVSLLHHRALWFSTLESLKKIDPMEGLFPPEYLRNSYNEDYDGLPDLTEDEHEHFRANFHDGVKDSRNVISCWHYNKNESQAMWKLYANGNVAIRSTPRRLLQLFANTAGFRHIRLVKYTLYEPGESWGHPEVAFYHKHKSLEHEQELRVLFHEFEYQVHGIHK